jgi:hypothetical protein
MSVRSPNSYLIFRWMVYNLRLNNWSDSFEYCKGPKKYTEYGALSKLLSANGGINTVFFFATVCDISISYFLHFFDLPVPEVFSDKKIKTSVLKVKITDNSKHDTPC